MSSVGEDDLDGVRTPEPPTSRQRESLKVEKLRQLRALDEQLGVAKSRMAIEPSFSRPMVQDANMQIATGVWNLVSIERDNQLSAGAVDPTTAADWEQINALMTSYGAAMREDRNAAFTRLLYRARELRSRYDPGYKSPREQLLAMEESGRRATTDEERRMVIESAKKFRKSTYYDRAYEAHVHGQTPEEILYDARARSLIIRMEGARGMVRAAS